MEQDAVAKGELADPGGGRAGHREPVALWDHRGALGGEQRSEGGRVGCAHDDARPGAAGGERGQALGGDEFAAADDDEPVGGVLHLGHQMAGDEHREYTA